MDQAAEGPASAPRAAARSFPIADRSNLAALFFVLLIFLFIPHRIEITDEEIFYNTAMTLLETGRPAVRVDDLTFFQRFPPAYSGLLAVHIAAIRPFLDAVAHAAGPASADRLWWWCVGCFNLAPAAGIFLLLERRLRAPFFVAAALASTMVFFYATTLFSEIFTAFFLLLAALHFAKRPHVAAAALAIAALLKVTNLVAVLAALPFLWRKRHSVSFLLLALVFPLAVHLAFNRIVRGAVFDFGYSPFYVDGVSGLVIRQGFQLSPFRALFGFLLSPGKSFLLYNPILLCAVPALAARCREGSVEARFAAAVAALLFVKYSFWSVWEGGMCFGPRLLLPIVPLALTGLTSASFNARRTVMILITIGIVLETTARTGLLYQAYLASGLYGTGENFPLLHNFLADQFRGFAALFSGAAPLPAAARELGFGSWLALVVVAILGCLALARQEMGTHPINISLENRNYSGQGQG